MELGKQVKQSNLYQTVYIGSFEPHYTTMIYEQSKSLNVLIVVRKTLSNLFDVLDVFLKNPDDICQYLVPIGVRKLVFPTCPQRYNHDETIFNSAIIFLLNKLMDQSIFDDFQLRFEYQRDKDLEILILP